MLTHPLSGSTAISLGLSSPAEITLRWLLPDKSDTDIELCVASDQYSCDVLHSTASPSQTPMLLMITVTLDPSIPERFMFNSVTSLQNM